MAYRSISTLIPLSAVAWLLCVFPFCSPLFAQSALSGGIWANYQYLPDDEANKNSWGEIGNEALIIYLDGAADEGTGNWRYSAEVQAGPGSFTDPDNNSTGDYWVIHKAWVGWQLNADHIVRVGKSQVPFGWKTTNFWPGDIFLAGFGDQMDVGVKLSGDHNTLHYDAALYLADDWGSTSTDTVDDNRHWGSATTYRKVQTLVVNGEWQVQSDHTLGLSLQAGRLQNLMSAERPVDGDHQAAVLFYEGTVDQWFGKASWIIMQRDLPDDYVISAAVPERIENQRLTVEAGYSVGPWRFYLDASVAEPDTRGSSTDAISAAAPGFSYDYGPGWVYLEYLNQDGYIDRDGRVNEGDFEALYVSLDFYL